MKLPRGFTLLELVVTLALAAIVLGLAVPSSINMIRSSRILSMNNDLVADMQFARSEAIKRNQAVTICASNATQTACQTSGNDWSDGWIVFVEGSTTFNGVVDTGEAIVRSHAGATNDTMTIKTDDASTLNVTFSVAYRGDGFPVIPSDSSTSTGAFLICENNDTSYSSKIKLYQTGRVESVGDSDTCS